MGRRGSMAGVPVCRLSSFCVLLATLLVTGCASQYYPASTDARVALRSRELAMSPSSTWAFMRALRTGERPVRYGLVQLTRHPDADERAGLAADGLVLLDPLLDSVYFASVRKTFDLQSGSARALVQKLSPIEPADKIAPALREERFQAYEVTPPAGQPFNYVLNPDGTLNLTVSFFGVVPVANAAGLLERLGARDVIRTSDTDWTVVLPSRVLGVLAAENEVRWIDAGTIPLLQENDGTRAHIGVDVLQDFDTTSGQVRGLGGAGVTVGVFDGNGETYEDGVDEDHDDLAGRVVINDKGKGLHATHVAGTLAGTGVRSAGTDSWGEPNDGADYQWRGMAPQAELLDVLYTGSGSADFLDRVIQIGSLDLANGSYSVSFDGEYNIANADRDELIRGDAISAYSGRVVPPRPQVYSAGNHGEKPVRGGEQVGYFSLTKQMKNALIVGNYDIEADRVATTSSLGPAHDGRIKPDLVAPGENVWSSCYCAPDSVIGRDLCRVDDTSTYRERGDFYCEASGTSMAAPAVSGVLALVLQQHAETYRVDLDEDPPLPSTLRAVLVQSARDIAADLPWFENEDAPVQAFVGPDFATGFGMVDAETAVRVIRERRLLEDVIEQTCDTRSYGFYVEEGQTEPVRLTLAWDDVPASELLGPRATKLRNDLDLVLIDPAGTRHYPWLLNQNVVDANGNPLPDEQQLCGTPIDVQRDVYPTVRPDFVDPGHPDNVNDPIGPQDLTAARTGKDHLNNIEQVVAPSMPGLWHAEVVGFGIPQGPQAFSLAGLTRSRPEIQVTPPSHDFGRARFNQVELVVGIANSGPHPLFVSSMELASADFRLYVDHERLDDRACGTAQPVLAPQDACEVLVRFEPRRAGNKLGRLEIRSDDPDRPVVQVTVLGESAWILEVAPETMDFGNVLAGSTSKPRLLSIRNVGTADGLEVQIAPLPYWYFTHGPGGLNPCESFNPTLAAGNACGMRFSFTPPARGIFSDEQVILSNDPTAPEVVVPLTGRGT